MGAREAGSSSIDDHGHGHSCLSAVAEAERGSGLDGTDFERVLREDVYRISPVSPSASLEGPAAHGPPFHEPSGSVVRPTKLSKFGLCRLGTNYSTLGFCHFKGNPLAPLDPLNSFAHSYSTEQWGFYTDDDLGFSSIQRSELESLSPPYPNTFL